MTDLKVFYVMYPDGVRRIEAEDRIDARDRATETWGRRPIDVWTAREIRGQS